MRYVSQNIPSLLLVALGCLSAGQASAIIHADAESVELRKDCTGRDDCFTSMDDLVAWTWQTRLPDAGAPLVVDIGPGDYSAFSCDSAGHVTLRGAGRDNTRIVRQDNVPAVSVNNCEALSFEHLTVSGGRIGVFWSGGGTSTWSDVDVVSTGFETYSWWDECANPEDKSVHYWFGSRIISNPSFYGYAYFGGCAESWFYGGDILSSPVNTGPGSSILSNVAVWLHSNAELQVFGSTVRSLTGEAANKSFFGTGTGRVGFITVAVGSHGSVFPDGGRFHMHGGILVANAAPAAGAVHVSGINVDSAASAHVVDTAFNVRPGGSGTATRIRGDNASSPFQWPPANDPPNVASKTGSDMFVEIDCAADGNCDGAGTETHVMVYNANCAVAGPWFDSTTGRCRGVITP